MGGEIYNKSYYDEYDTAEGKVNYKDASGIKAFLAAVADRIVSDLHPRTVLDTGCAMGHLVAALRDRGVEAYGIDISEYAISQVREDIRPFCAVCSLTEQIPDSFPRHFDLVTNIEVMEHLYAVDGKKAVGNLTSLTDQILFSSTPDGFEDPTHLNVQQREYWARIFAEYRFYDNLLYRPLYLSEYAVLYKKLDDPLQAVESYERFIRQSEDLNKKQRIDSETRAAVLQSKLTAQEEETHRLQKLAGETEQKLIACEGQLSDQLKKTQETEKELNKLKEQNSQTDKELAYYMLHYHAAVSQRDELNARVGGLAQELAKARQDYLEISNAFFWKITKPARFVLIFLKWSLRPHSGEHLLRRGLHSLRTRGVRVTWRKAVDKIYSDMSKKPIVRPEPFTKQELAEQRKQRFPRDIRFSLAVPLYNTQEKLLREMIDSVLAQTYPDWELCMADGSDAEHGDVERICRKYAKRDRRIRYRKLEKNLGISGNTNACLEMASGDYIGLLDHDDLLHPAALYEVMRAVCEKGADFIYTDETVVHDTPGCADLPHFKPAFAPDNLRANNYICHFSVFKRSLLEETGLFDPACDGSQDHDMVLRLTEKAERIAHIPEILYYWRAHQGSVAESVGMKPYVIEAGVRAVEKQLARLGLEGTVEPVRPGLTFYRIRYKISGMPRVSILIPSYEHLDCLKTCLDSVFSKTTWLDYEIVIVENGSTSPDVFAYYDEIQKARENVRVVTWQGQFNYSAVNNFGARYCTGDYLLLLNNDVEVITPGWIEEMLMFAQRSDVGAVGAMLYYPDNTVQHAGVGLGLGGVAGHYFNKVARNLPGYSGRLLYAQDMSAVTAACMMLRRDVWEKVQGFDGKWAVAFNDIDLCMRIRQAGYLIVWTPFAELYHHESESRGNDDTLEKQERFHQEVINFRKRWKDELAAGDFYFNPNFSLDRSDFTVVDVLEQHDAR